MNPSTAQARVLVDELLRSGLAHAVVCPGSRNAPLSLALHAAAEAGRLRLHVRIDERSAGYLALGLAARSEAPVVLVCTSGTAAANFHPAVTEADRAGVALLVLTADRPAELRAAGANQVIDQHRLYGGAVRHFAELALARREPGQVAYWRSEVCRADGAARGHAAGATRPGPVHLNIPFAEPLVPDENDPGVGASELVWGSELAASEPGASETGASEPGWGSELGAGWCEPLAGRSGGRRWTELPGGPDPVDQATAGPSPAAPGAPALGAPAAAPTDLGPADQSAATPAAPEAAAPAPAAPGATAPDASAAIVPWARRGLVIACDVSPRELAAASAWAATHWWPIISETGAAGLAGEATMAAGPWLLDAPEFLAAHTPQQVICFGRPTVFRQVAALLTQPNVDVSLVRPGSDWPAPGHDVREVGHRLAAPAAPADPEWLPSWQRADAAAARAVAGTLAAAGWPTGPAVAADVVTAIPPGSLLVLGSSNPTREVPLAAAGARGDLLVHRNRGAAGIDGTVSTAVGAALAHGGPTYALLGDLTLLHDAGGLLAPPGESAPDLAIVVANDDGGGVFSLLEQGAEGHSASFERVFGTPHGRDLGALCAGYGVAHIRTHSRAELRAALAPAPGLRVVEVRLERSARRGLQDRLRAAVREAVQATG